MHWPRPVAITSEREVKRNNKLGVKHDFEWSNEGPYVSEEKHRGAAEKTRSVTEDSTIGWVSIDYM